MTPRDLDWTPERRSEWQRRWKVSQLAGDRALPMAPVRAARAGRVGRFLRGIVRIFK